MASARLRSFDKSALRQREKLELQAPLACKAPDAAVAQIGDGLPLGSAMVSCGLVVPSD
jgi:hypothetical protein